MASVLFYNNFYRADGDAAISPLLDSTRHDYTLSGPGVFRANPYTKRKHTTVFDLIKRLLASIILATRSLFYDVLVVDSAINAALVCCCLWIIPRPRIVVANFNIPRRRNGIWKLIWRIAYRRVDVFVVHSRNDIALASKLLNVPDRRFKFAPFRRTQPVTQSADRSGYNFPSPPYVISTGGNARDYATLCQAVADTGISIVVVAPEYRLRSLSIPENVTIHSGIPLDTCDVLVSNSLFSVLTFDGSEPSCGQISIVTSLMLGKPVICTDIAGIRDYVKDDINGLFVPIFGVEELRTSILSLYHDKQLYSRLASGAEETASKHFTVEAYRASMDDLITELTFVKT